MTGMHDEPQDDATREVRDAFRDLPPLEPGATLDARVRAAVAAELRADGGAAPRRAVVIAFPRWPRKLRGVALAATVVLAVGVGYRLQTHDPGLEQAQNLAPSSDAAPRPLTAASPAPASAPARALVSAAAEDEKRSPPPPPPPAARMQRLEVASPATAPSSGGGAADASRLAGVAVTSPPPAQAIVVLPERAVPMSAPAAMVLHMVESPPSPAAEGVRPAEAKLAKPAPPAADADTFEAVRRLLREQRRDEALAMLRRWREAHRDGTIPLDLQPLLAEPPR
jgi:hypothetical protein